MRFIIIVTGSILLLLLTCIQKYNPYEDPNNMVAFVSDKSFRNGDSISIFTTQYIEIKPLVQEKIDSFTVSVFDNRLWSKHDTTIINTGSLKNTYLFNFSFDTTGTKQISVTTFRKGFENITQEFRLHLFCKLYQDSLQGVFDSTITLNAHAEHITDKDIMFHWSFGNGHLISSPRSKFDTIIKHAAHNNKGTLYVSDKSGTSQSPEDTFFYTFIDNTKPVITCLNKPGKDSIATGDSIFIFEIQALDRGDIFVDSVTINDSSFTNKNRHKKYHFEIMPEIYRYSKLTPFKAFVAATDEAGNVAEHTYWIYYNKGGDTSNSTNISFTSVVDTIDTVSVQHYDIHGWVLNRKGIPLILRASLEDSLIDERDTILSGEGDWSFRLYLKNATTEVSVFAYDTNLVKLAQKSVTIFYDSTIEDKKAPVIWRIQADSVDVTGRPMYLPNREITLSVKAFDRESAVEKVLVNSQPADSINSNTWQLPVSLQHDTNFSVPILVSDKWGNKKDTAIYLCQNQIPNLVDTTTNFFIPLGKAYSKTLPYTDPDADGDRVSHSFVQLGSWWQRTGKTISWTPQEVKTDTVKFYLSDGFQKSKEFTYTFSVIIPVRFAKGLIDTLPRNLIVGQDTLTLTCATTTPSASARYDAFITPGAISLLDSTQDSIVFWVPQLADPGQKTLVLTVHDNSQTGDTLYHTFRVHNLHNTTCSLSVSVTPSQVLREDTLDISDSIVAVLDFAIHDDNSNPFEKYVASITRPTETKEYTVDSMRFQEQIKPILNRGIEELVVSVNDTITKSKSPSMRFFIKHPIDTIPSNRIALWCRADTAVLYDSNTKEIDRWYDCVTPNRYFQGFNPGNGRMPRLVLHGNNSYEGEMVSLATGSTPAGVYMDGYSDWADSSFTIFIVAMLTISPGDDKLYSLIATTGYGDATNFGVVNTAPGVFNYIDDEINFQFFQKNYSFTPSLYYIFAYYYNAQGNNNFYCRINGQGDTLRLSTVQILPLSNTQLGANTASLLNPWFGGVAEVVIYDRFLNDGEIRHTESVLSKKYDIDLTKSVYKEE